MVKRLFWALATLILGLAASLYMMKMAERHNAQVLEFVEEAERGVPSWASGKFDAVALEVQSNYAAAAEAFASNDFSRAYSLAYYGGKNTLEMWTGPYGTNVMASGETVRAFAERLHAAYASNVVADLDRVMEDVKRGDLPMDDLRNIVAWHSDIREVQQKYSAQQQAIAQARAKAARRWLRVSVLADFMTKEFEALFLRVIMEKGGDLPGIKLVRGYSSGYEEDQATFKTIEVRLESKHAQYRVENRNKRGGDWTPPMIPEACHVTFTVKQAQDVSTTWDNLPAIDVSKTAPDKVRADEADAVFNAQSTDLFELVRQKAEALPVFSLYPGVDVSSVAIYQSGRFDPEAFRVLTFKDPARLDGQLKGLLGTGDAALRDALCAALVERGDDRYGTWVAQRIQSAPSALSQGLVQALASNPTFGGYDPILAAIRKGPGYTYELTQVLQHHLDKDKVRKLFLEKIAGPGSDRGNFATLFIAGVPQSELPKCAAWLRDVDPNFARTVFTALLNADRDLANRVVIDQFDNVATELQSLMLGQYHADPKYGDAGMSVYRRALNSGNAQIRQAAVEALIGDAAHSAAGWDLLQDAASHEGDPAQRDRMEETLLYQVRQAHPDRAEAYFVRTMQDKRGSQREVAINSLLELDGPKDERVKQVADVMNAAVGDAELAEHIVASVRQYISIRKGWNFAQPELMDIIARGVADADPRVRGCAYDIMVEGVKQGAPDFERELAQLLDQEKDPKLKAEKQKALERVQKK